MNYLKANRMMKRYTDTRYYDDLEGVAKAALRIILVPAKFLGRVGLRLIQIIMRGIQLFNMFGQAVDTLSYVQARSAFKEAEKAAEELGQRVEDSGVQAPSGFDFAIRTLKRTFVVAAMEIGHHFANKLRTSEKMMY